MSLQHDTGRWCTEYTWSADDNMLGARVLHNFGKLVREDPEGRTRQRVKRVDEEDAMEGGLKGRISAGAEVYFSAQEKSGGGEEGFFICIHNLLNWYQCRRAYALPPFPMLHLRRFKCGGKRLRARHLLLNHQPRSPQPTIRSWDIYRRLMHHESLLTYLYAQGIMKLSSQVATDV
jgi:hypothetical protein